MIKAPNKDQSSIECLVSTELKKFTKAEIDTALEFMELHKEDGVPVFRSSMKAKTCGLARTRDPASARRAPGCELCASGPAFAAAWPLSRPSLPRPSWMS